MAVGKNLGTTTRVKEIRKPQFDKDDLLTSEVLQIMSSSTNYEEFVYAILTQVNKIIGEGSWKSEVVNSLKDLSIWHKSSKEIDPGNTEIVDSFPDNFNSANYFLTATMGGNTITEQINVIKSSSGLSHSISGKIGKGISFSINPDVQSSNFVLEVTNNDISKIEIGIIRAISGN